MFMPEQILQLLMVQKFTVYHNNLTLEEAIKIYESIPAERMHGGKGIGFDLQDGDEDYSGEYELMSWDRVDRELIKINW